MAYTALLSTGILLAGLIVLVPPVGAARMRLAGMASMPLSYEEGSLDASDVDATVNATLDKCDLSRYNFLHERFTDMKYAGSGASGCVTLAKDTKNGGVDVAIKVSKTPGNLRKWQKECTQAKAIHGAACDKKPEDGGEALKLVERYIPTCLEVGGTDDAPYMVMHAAGGDGIKKAFKFSSQSDRISVYAQFVGAVMAMHGVGFMHCDLTHQNAQVLWGTKDVTLIDYGSTRTIAKGHWKRSSYKNDEVVFANHAWNLARCPGGSKKAKELATDPAVRKMLLECLKDNWGADEEFLKVLGDVMEEAWDPSRQPTLTPALYRTAFVQNHQPPLKSLFPLGECSK